MLLPFSERARQAAQKVDLAIDDAAIESAKKLIEVVKSKQLRELQASDDLQQVKQLAICKVILSLCPYPIIADFANNYSLLWKRHFATNVNDSEEFAREVFPSITFGSQCKISVFDYLAAEENILIVDVSNGYVHLTKDHLSDVLAHQIKRRVMSIPSSANMPESVKIAAEELAKQYAAFLPKGAKNLEKEEIKKIRQGSPEGGRFYGCMKLSRACFRDGLSFEEAKQIILEYVKACSPGKNPFTEKEALTCLEWLYRKGQKLVSS